MINIVLLREARRKCVVRYNVEAFRFWAVENFRQNDFSPESDVGEAKRPPVGKHQTFFLDDDYFMKNFHWQKKEMASP